MSRAVVADPRAVAERAVDPVVRTLAQLTRSVTETPWKLGPADRAHAFAVGLSDETLVHVVILSAFFGHLNRMADAIGVALDYPVVITPPHAEPATPSYLRPAPAEWPSIAGGAALDLALRPAVIAPLDAWRVHVLEREGPLDLHQRAVIAHAVAERLGDATTAQHKDSAPLSPLDAALVATADEVTLAPWRLGAGTVARLRQAGLTEEATIFDAITTATSCTTFSRLRVALAALGA